MRRRFLVWTLLFVILAALVPTAAAHGSPKVPLVLVHGLYGSPNTTWGMAMKYFEGKGYVRGSTLFAIDLRPNLGDNKDLGVLIDAHTVSQEIKRIMANTNSKQVDLVGNSRGGLVVRLLATGETAPLIRRAVTIGTPHAGVLAQEDLLAILAYARVDASFTSSFSLPADLQNNSTVLKTIQAREARFTDQKAPALAVSSTFRDGLPPVLSGHDGFVALQSQQSWPGARSVTLKIGPTVEELAMIVLEGNPLRMIGAIPHVSGPETEAVLGAVYAFLEDHDADAPPRACEPACKDWAKLQGHWSAATVQPMLPALLPYDVDEKGNREFDPERKVTRAEFIYALAKSAGLNEKFGQTAFTDMRGHWALGYVEAAVAAGLVTGISNTSFAPELLLDRAQAATLIARAKKLETQGKKSRFKDAQGHWAEAAIEAAAEIGILTGYPDGRFGASDQLTMAQAAVILARAFKQ